MHIDHFPIFPFLWVFHYFHLLELCITFMPWKRALYLCTPGWKISIIKSELKKNPNKRLTLQCVGVLILLLPIQHCVFGKVVVIRSSLQPQQRKLHVQSSVQSDTMDCVGQHALRNVPAAKSQVWWCKLLRCTPRRPCHCGKLVYCYCYRST